MSKRTVIAFSEGPVEEMRELTESEITSLGIKITEESAPGFADLKKSVAASYVKLGLSESEANLAADLDLRRRM